MDDLLRTGGCHMEAQIGSQGSDLSDKGDAQRHCLDVLGARA